MEKPVVDMQREYHMCYLVQWCSQCTWKGEGHSIEIEICPECGAPVHEDCIAKFGGTIIEYESRKDRFSIRPTNRGDIYGTIFSADFADAIIFMLKHNKFWRK